MRSNFRYLLSGELAADLREIRDNLRTLLLGEKLLVAQIDDLNTAVAALTAQEQTNATDIQVALTALAAAAPADLQPAIAAINKAVTDLAASDTALGAATAPPATPPV